MTKLEFIGLHAPGSDTSKIAKVINSDTAQSAARQCQRATQVLL